MSRPTIALSMYPGFERYALRPEHRERLAAVGDVLDDVAIESLPEDRAAAVLAEAEVLIGHWGCARLDVAFLDRAPRLQLLAYAAGTVRDVVTPEAFARLERITSAAAANAEPVAEYTLAAILWGNKDAFAERERTRGVDVPRPARRKPVGNWNKRIGLIGASHVGRATARLLLGFPHLEVVIADPFLPAGEAEAMGATLVELDELLATSDGVSIHAPWLPETEGLVGRAELARMRDGAVLINTARPALLDHDALVDEVASGRLTAVLDVTDPEPLPLDHPLLHLPGCVVTPHLAGAQGTELSRLADLAVEEVERWVAGTDARYPVTAADVGRIA